jgi:hypothetical protein
MNLELLGNSKNNKQVFYDPINSHAATHIEDTPQLRDLVIEVLANTVLENEYLEFERDMGRTIGTTDGVINDEGDELVWAKRKNRESYTVFNKSKSPQPSRFLTMALSQQDVNSYILESAFVSTGEGSSPPFPDEPNAPPESREYWSKHALAWGTQEIQEGTLTTECPW